MRIGAGHAECMIVPNKCPKRQIEPLEIRELDGQHVEERRTQMSEPQIQQQEPRTAALEHVNDVISFEVSCLMMVEDEGGQRVPELMQIWHYALDKTRVVA